MSVMVVIRPLVTKHNKDEKAKALIDVRTRINNEACAAAHNLRSRWTT